MAHREWEGRVTVAILVHAGGPEDGERENHLAISWSLSHADVPSYLSTPATGTVSSFLVRHMHRPTFAPCVSMHCPGCSIARPWQ
ncbi:hypothetical protein FKP32DRAFT_1598461 [Trametes sanguinea]|nr:hypothetical protein FKP32DRAFT_1598461 [Trametes sanguinea]